MGKDYQYESAGAGIFIFSCHSANDGKWRWENCQYQLAGRIPGEPDAPAYGASKAGLNAFSQSMAKALAPFKIFVYAIAPGFVESEMAASVLAGD